MPRGSALEFGVRNDTDDQEEPKVHPAYGGKRNGRGEASEHRTSGDEDHKEEQKTNPAFAGGKGIAEAENYLTKDLDEETNFGKDPDRARDKAAVDFTNGASTDTLTLKDKMDFISLREDGTFTEQTDRVEARMAQESITWMQGKQFNSDMEVLREAALEDVASQEGTHWHDKRLAADDIEQGFDAFKLKAQAGWTGQYFNEETGEVTENRPRDLEYVKEVAGRYLDDPPIPDWMDPANDSKNASPEVAAHLRESFGNMVHDLGDRDLDYKEVDRLKQTMELWNVDWNRAADGTGDADSYMRELQTGAYDRQVNWQQSKEESMEALKGLANSDDANALDHHITQIAEYTQERFYQNGKNPDYANQNNVWDGIQHGGSGLGYMAQEAETNLDEAKGFALEIQNNQDLERGISDQARIQELQVRNEECLVEIETRLKHADFNIQAVTHAGMENYGEESAWEKRIERETEEKAPGWGGRGRGNTENFNTQHQVEDQVEEKLTDEYRKSGTEFMDKLLNQNLMWKEDTEKFMLDESRLTQEQIDAIEEMHNDPDTRAKDKYNNFAIAVNQAHDDSIDYLKQMGYNDDELEKAKKELDAVLWDLHLLNDKDLLTEFLQKQDEEREREKNSKGIRGLINRFMGNGEQNDDSDAA